MFTLGRKIDINYPTNKIIIILSLIIGFIGMAITGVIKSGLYIALGIFSTWALAREVDPGHEKSAFIAVSLSIVNLFYYERIEALAIFWLILLMRMISGITGKELKPLDFLIMFIMTIYLSITAKNTIHILIFLLSMAILIILKKQVNLALMASGPSLIALYILEKLFIVGPLSINKTNYSDTINIFVIAIVSVSFVFWRYISMDIVKDDYGNVVNKSNIRWSQIIYNIAFILMFFLGDMTINNLIIHLSVIIGVIIYFLRSYELFPKI